MALNVLGIWSVAVFYLLILLVGIGAAWIQKRRGRRRSDSNSQPQEDIMLASRNLSLVAGVFTMTGIYISNLLCSFSFKTIRGKAFSFKHCEYMLKIKSVITFNNRNQGSLLT